MPTVDPIITDDALLLSIEAYTFLSASQYKNISGNAHTVNTVHVDHVFGTAYAGAFFAGPLASGQRPFLALLVGEDAAVYKVTGVLNDTVEGLEVVSHTDTLQVGAWNSDFPHYIGLVTSTGSVTGTIDGVAWTSSVGFTFDIGGQILMRLDSNTDICTAKLYTSRVFSGNSISFLPFPSGVSPVFTGLGDPSVWGAPERRLFAGTALDRTAIVDDGALATLTYSDEQHTHAIVGAQFGDLEFDVGKSVPWVKLFTDDIFIADINSGDPRYWVIDWDRSFRDSKVLSLGVDYFTDPVGWRKAQFAAADAAWGYSDDDWVLFIDGSEGLSCDTRSLPDDVTVSPFRSFIHREITRATNAGRTQVCFPWYAFVRNASQPDPRRFYQITDTTLVQDQQVALPLDQANVSVVNVAVPYYVQPENFTERGLVRLVKVSALRNPAFDWTRLDTLSQPDDDVKMQLISYAYARWTNPNTGEEDGMKMRAKISQVRPLAALPVVGTDSAGVGGPYTVADQGVLVDIPGATAQTQPLLTPMYSSLFRVSPQDGVWYVAGGMAPDVPPPPFAFAFPPPTGLALAQDATVQVDQ